MHINGEALYSATVEDFLLAAKTPDKITDILKEGYCGLNVGPELSEEQCGAWTSEVLFLRDKLLGAEEVKGEIQGAVITLEMPVGNRGERVDAVLCGQEELGKPHVSLMEFKTWHSERKNGRRYEFHAFHDADNRGLLINLITLKDEAQWDHLSSSIVIDPRQQVYNYRRVILEILGNIPGKKNPDEIVEAMVVLYNLAKPSRSFQDAMNYAIPSDDQVARVVPIYTQRAENGSHSMEELKDRIVRNFRGGNGEKIYRHLWQRLSGQPTFFRPS